MIQEDSVIEYLQAIFYFLASLFSLLVSIRFLKNKLILHGVLYCVLTIGLLFAFMEEISWGQRIFKIQTPDFLIRKNVQKELTIHNLKAVHYLLRTIYELIGAYGAFAWLFVWLFRRLFVSKTQVNCRNIFNYIIPDLFISSYFFFILFVYEVIYKCNVGAFIWWRDQEPAELLLSLGFLFFAGVNYLKLRICLASAPNNTGHALR